MLFDRARVQFHIDPADRRWCQGRHILLAACIRKFSQRNGVRTHGGSESETAGVRKDELRLVVRRERKPFEQLRLSPHRDHRAGMIENGRRCHAILLQRSLQYLVEVGPVARDDAVIRGRGEKADDGHAPLARGIRERLGAIDQEQCRGCGPEQDQWRENREQQALGQRQIAKWTHAGEPGLHAPKGMQPPRLAIGRVSSIWRAIICSRAWEQRVYEHGGQISGRCGIERWVPRPTSSVRCRRCATG